MFNIIQNAIKYNKKGGLITIIMNLTPVKDHNWMFTTNVIDTGSGIDNERLPYLFKLFGELKINNSLQYVKDNGIGIGLTCSKTIVDFLGGKIAIKSSPGFTDVKISIPVSSSEKSETGGSKNAPRSPISKSESLIDFQHSCKSLSKFESLNQEDKDMLQQMKSFDILAVLDSEKDEQSPNFSHKYQLQTKKSQTHGQ